MVGVCLFGQVRLVYIHSVVFIIIVFKVGKAKAARILTVTIMAAGTAAAETNLGGFDTLTEGIAVYEAKTVWDDLGVNLIDNGDWVGLVSGKRADLAPVAVGLFIFSVLGHISKRSPRPVAECSKAHKVNVLLFRDGRSAALWPAP